MDPLIHCLLSCCYSSASYCYCCTDWHAMLLWYSKQTLSATSSGLSLPLLPWTGTFLTLCRIFEWCIYTINICIEAWAFIPYRLFLTRHLNETSVYSGPCRYLFRKHTRWRGTLWTNWCYHAYIINLQFEIFTCNNEIWCKPLHSLWYSLWIWYLLEL